MKKSILAAIPTVLMLLTIAASGNAGENATNGGDIIYTKPVRSVLFSHKTHVDEKGLTCDLCHSGTFEMKALKSQENPDFTMEGFSKSKYCGACHNGTMAFSANSRCASCHAGVKGGGSTAGMAHGH